MSKPAPSTSVYAPREAPGRRYENGIRRDSMEPISREQYNQIVENPYQKTAEAPVSTFSIDVDAASYSNVRRILNQGGIPPTDAVRIEEMINYFDYQYPEPANEHPIEVITELSPCPWNNEHHLLMIGLQGRRMDLGQLPPSNLVFLLDVSGSMNEENKLPLVKQSMHLLIDQLRPEDRVAIVVYAGAAGLVLESTPASDKAKIEAALDRLSAGGSTAGGAGIQLAYQTARANMKPGGNNRVVLCTDGDFNVGISNQADLVKLIETERESGVYLSVLGFGTGNYQDGTMQMLADKGNGNHAYIDQISEANKVLVKEFGGTLFAIAKDVKLQLDFNPDQVAEYRLIGYENRMLAKEDFDDDTKDAGELGAGHTVTALYEIVPAKSKPAQKAHSDRLMTLKFRYKKPTGNQASRLIEKEISAVCAVKPSDNMQLATAVAEFGLLLRDSKYKGNATFEHALNLARSSAKAKDPDGYRAELATLIEQAKTRSGK